MTFYHGPYDGAIKFAQSQLSGEKPIPPTAYDDGKPLDILLEILSGVPQTSIMSELAAALQFAVKGDSSTEGGDSAGLSEYDPAGRRGVRPIKGGEGDILPPTITSVENIGKITRSMFESSAPVLDTEQVIGGAIQPNAMFHIGSVLTVGIVSIIGELLSIGQVDGILQPLLSFLDLTDAPTVYNAVRNIRLDNQVFQPYRYHVNEQNPILIPPYSDLIRLRVREDRLGAPIISQDEFIQQMKYSGFAEFWSNALWDAHFTLPSNRELFQMYNINLITKEELRKQLIVNDIAPEWVDNIAEIAKRYPTMPELRMMSRRIVIPSELVERALRAQGIREEYFPYYQQMFTDWDVDRIQKRKQTSIVSSYRDGFLGDEEFRNIIANAGASTNEGEEMLLEAQWKRFDRRMGDRQKTVIKLLQKGRILRDDAEEVLISMGFEPIDVDHWLDYAIAATGATVDIEDISEGGIEGLDTEEVRDIKFAEWKALEPPMLYPFEIEDFEEP